MVGRMPAMLDKIAAHAKKKLVFPPGSTPAEELERYKEFLRLGNQRIRMFHRAGGGGLETCHARAGLVDVLLQNLWDAAGAPHEGGRETPVLALVAIGGYGRGELNHLSDIDLMFLHNGETISASRLKPQMASLMDRLLYPLWDLGLKIGHSVRSAQDCVGVANSDMQSKTALLEARLVAGNRQLFEKMQRVFLARCVRGFEDAYIAARIDDQEARRARYGQFCLQEPNIKNGSGGLRDYQNLLWMILFKYRLGGLAQLEEKEMISESERKKLEGAYDFLLWVRNELHYQVKRPADVLTRNLQPVIASNLGYHERSPSKRIERFMREVYTHMRNIYLITRTLEQRLALLPQRKRLPSLRSLLRAASSAKTVDGFKFTDGYILASSPRIFRDQPRRLIRVFRHAQLRNLQLHPELAQMIGNHLSLVDREFLRDEHVRQTFLEILDQRGNAAWILRAMHETGLLGRYLPEFGKLTCLVQHEFYHQYTADEHTLVCLEMLDRIWEAQAAPFSNYSGLLQNFERPFLLYLAVLLHDAGKAYRDADHCSMGARIALKVARRLQLDGATTHSLRLVIENHLAMAQISQRRDLDDPGVIRQFASLVQTQENLDLLTLHTFADSQGTSAQLWNGFKDTLLWTLYSKTREMLAGQEIHLRAEKTQREFLLEEVCAIKPASIKEDEVLAHFDALPRRYFHIHSPREVLLDLSLAHRFMHLQLAEEEKALEPVIHWHNEPDCGYSVVHICTWDRVGLFSKIAGSLTAAGLNILGAQIYTREDGIILDKFLVTDARTGSLAGREEKEKFEQLLHSSLTGYVNLPALIARQTSGKSLYRAFDGEKISTVIRIDADASEYYTLIEVETEDRIGLLYLISQTFSDLHLNIYVAKVTTEKGAAIDSFYVAQENGRKVSSPEYQQVISEQLKAAIESLDLPSKASP